MTCSALLSLFGLILGFIGSLVLIIPNLSKTRNLDDDFIIEADRKTGDYTQKKHLKERKINLWGFLFLGFGFLFQLVALFFTE